MRVSRDRTFLVRRTISLLNVTPGWVTRSLSGEKCAGTYSCGMGAYQRAALSACVRARCLLLRRLPHIAWLLGADARGQGAHALQNGGHQCCAMHSVTARETGAQQK